VAIKMDDGNTARAAEVVLAALLQRLLPPRAPTPPGGAAADRRETARSALAASRGSQGLIATTSRSGRVAAPMA
jgi:hypothetical protein